MRTTTCSLLLSLVSVACQAQTPAVPVMAVPPAPVAEALAPALPATATPLQVVWWNYDAMRTRLAADDGSDAPRYATALASAASAAAKSDGPAQATLASLAVAAQQLAQAPPVNLGSTRLAFAEVSKHMVALMVADPSLQKGRFIFECPMAKTFQKWVQTTPQLRNPYFGSKMLDCGIPSTWS